MSKSILIPFLNFFFLFTFLTVPALSGAQEADRKEGGDGYQGPALVHPGTIRDEIPEVDPVCGDGRISGEEDCDPESLGGRMGEICDQNCEFLITDEQVLCVKQSLDPCVTESRGEIAEKFKSENTENFSDAEREALREESLAELDEAYALCFDQARDHCLTSEPEEPEVIKPVSPEEIPNQPPAMHFSGSGCMSSLGAIPVEGSGFVTLAGLLLSLLTFWRFKR